VLAAALFGFLNCHERETREPSKIDFFSERAQWPRIAYGGRSDGSSVGPDAYDDTAAASGDDATPESAPGATGAVPTAAGGDAG